MSAFITSDQMVLARATWLYNHLVDFGRARLFTNNLVITPDTVFADFAQANFAGYSWVSLAGYLHPPVRIAPAVYRINCDLITVESLGTPVNTIYGCYVDDGTILMYSGLFAEPITVTTGITVNWTVKPQVDNT